MLEDEDKKVTKPWIGFKTWTLLLDKGGTTKRKSSFYDRDTAIISGHHLPPSDLKYAGFLF